MSKLDAKKLRSRYEAYGARQYRAFVEEACEAGDLTLDDLSIRHCFEHLVPGGRDILDSVGSDGGYIHESIAGVDSTAFYHTFGPPITRIIQNMYEAEGNTLSSMVPTITGSDYEKRARITGLGAVGEEVPENGLYPHMGLGEDWILLPRLPKYGVILPITLETIRKDRTGEVIAEAGRIGEAAATTREKQLINLLIGVTNNHNWAGTAYDTYQAGPTPWDNILAAAGAFEDHTDLGAIDNMFAMMTDPATGEPIVIGGTTILTHLVERATVAKVINGTEIRFTSGGGIETLSPNPEPNWSVRTSRQFSHMLDAAIADDTATPSITANTTMFAGDFSKAFAIAEDWPIRVDRAPSGSEAEFNQDIPVRFKVSWKATPVVLEPRAVIRRDVA